MMKSSRQGEYVLTAYAIDRKVQRPSLRSRSAHAIEAYIDGPYECARYSELQL